MKKILHILILISACAIAGEASAATLAKPANNMGLVGYWSFNEGTSTVAGDSSGNNKTGTLFGTTLPTWVPGKFGTALSFDGTSSRVNLGSVTTPATTTISMWIKTSSASQKPAFSNRGAGVYYGVNGGGLFLYDNSASPTPGMTSTGKVNDNQWHHVVWTSDSVTSSMYIDGVLDKTQAQARGADTGTAYFGFDNSNTEYFPGSIDEARIYNRALSATEVAALYSGGSHAARGIIPNNLGLLGYWSFNERAGTVATDFSSGKGNNGAISNGTWSGGKFNGGLSFNGSNTSVNLGTMVGPTNEITISAWVKKNSHAAWSSIVDRYGSESLDCFTLGFDNSTGQKLMFMWNSQAAAWANKVTGDSVIPLNEWVHVGASSNGSTVTFYVNGVADGTQSSGAVCASGNVYIGANFPGGDEYFNGDIDEVRIYERALTATEMQGLYEAGQARVNTSSSNLTHGSSLASGLVGLWTFDGADTTDKVYDRSGQANNGYFVGGATSTAKTIGKLGQALKFDGANDYVSLGTQSTFNLGSSGEPMSACTWVKRRSSGAHEGPIWAEGSFYMRLNGDTTGDVGVWGLAANVTGLVLDDWQHICFSWDGVSTIQSYVDGIANGSGSGTSISGSSPSLALGARLAQSAYFDGSIDDVRLYNRALTAAEVLQLYNAGK